MVTLLPDSGDSILVQQLMPEAFMSQPHSIRTPLMAAAGILAAFLVASTFAPTSAQDRRAKQELLPVDWGNSEVAAAAAKPGVRSTRDTLGGLDPAKLAGLDIPVLAFGQTPQLVRNILGNDAMPTKPRVLITDPQQPVWYQLEDTYDGISISIEADRRVNQRVASDFQIGKRSLGAEATLGTKDKPKVSILDGETEEGMAGVILSYTLSRFPDIPYTITIECTGEKRQQCKDLATIAKDQALLKVIAARGR